MNLKRLISQGESGILEFKGSLQLKDEIGETVSAFSNLKGGIILIGISDEKEIKGIQVGKKTLTDLAEYIKRNTDPQIYPEVSTSKIENRTIISIKIKESDEKPVFFKSHAYKRVGDTTQRISSSEIRKLAKESKGKIYWDEQIYEDANLDEIDEDKIKWFLKEARRERGLKIPDDADIKEVLMRLKLLKNGKLANAALLLFSKERKFLQSEIKCIRFSGNKPVKPYIDFQTLEGDVFDLVNRAEDFVLRNIRKAVWLVPGKVQREEKHEYPPDAIREAIVNAVVHRDYTSPSKVQVRIFDDYIEIWNPGKLPEGWTVEKLKQKHESIPRSPLLFKQFFWIKYVEDVGGGTLDMIEQCKEWGIPDPEFEDTGTSIIVTFKKSILTQDALEQLGLNERQIKALEFIKQNRRISTKEYCNLFSVVKDTANRDLNDLIDKGLIKRAGSGPKTYYTLSTVRYRPIPSDTQTKNE